MESGKQGWSFRQSNQGEPLGMVTARSLLRRLSPPGLCGVGEGWGAGLRTIPRVSAAVGQPTPLRSEPYFSRPRPPHSLLPRPNGAAIELAKQPNKNINHSLCQRPVGLTEF
jgi:hypothetical protein